jgi:hypothetical protein
MFLLLFFFVSFVSFVPFVVKQWSGGVGSVFLCGLRGSVVNGAERRGLRQAGPS